ncbi:kinase-like domain-containing protein [Butyriboletus roseoflavus]|nr:kinase-like domain-containing protein [Butyriboletus roseoflavus]
MDHFHAPTPQSATSIPQGMEPYRCQSMAYDVLITPPVSPGHSEDGADASPAGVMMVRQEQVPHPEKPSSQGLQSQLHQDPALQAIYPHWQPIDPQRPLTPPPQPARSLENEQVHVEKPGVLKLTDFEVRGALGTGTFGRVLLVRLKSATPGSQNIFAMKVLRKVEIVRLRQVEHVNAERYILSRVRHPFVVDLFATFQDSLNIYMLMSYVPGGELFTHLRRAQKFTPDVTRFYLANIILALKYLHSFNIIYRDPQTRKPSPGFTRLPSFDRFWVCQNSRRSHMDPVRYTRVLSPRNYPVRGPWEGCGLVGVRNFMF